MNLSDYFKELGRGSASALCEAIKGHSSDVSDWATGKKQVPAERCPQIEAATKGMVRCEDLRPDVAWGVLRGNTAQAPASIAQAATNTVAEA